MASWARRWLVGPRSRGITHGRVGGEGNVRGRGESVACIWGGDGEGFSVWEGGDGGTKERRGVCNRHSRGEGYGGLGFGYGYGYGYGGGRLGFSVNVDPEQAGRAEKS